MQLIPRVREYHDELTAWRRDIHAHPELGFNEHRTAGLVAERRKLARAQRMTPSIDGRLDKSSS